MLGGFEGAAARRAASVDAMEARKERRWITRESLYSAAPAQEFISESPQKCDQLLTLLGGELEAELMAFDGALPLVRRSKTTRHVSLAQSVGVEQLLQAGDRAVMETMTAIPQAF